MRSAAFLLSIVVACGEPAPVAPPPATPPPSAPSASVAVAPSAAPAPPPPAASTPAPAQPPVPTGPPFDVTDRPAIEFRCFAWSQAIGLGACVVGLSATKEKASEYPPSFKLVRPALREGVVAPPAIDLETNAKLMISAKSRKDMSEALRGFTAWTPTPSETKDGYTLGALEVRSYSMVYEPGGAPIYKMRAIMKGDSQYAPDIAASSPPPKSVEIRFFSAVPGWILVEARFKGGGPVENEVDIHMCVPEKATCTDLSSR